MTKKLYALVLLLGFSLNASSLYAVPIEQSFDGIAFIQVISDDYIFGSAPSQLFRRTNEGQRRVPLGHTFWISKYEVTQDQWVAVMGSNPSTFLQTGPNMNAPVETISWHQAKAFIAELNTNAGGEHYRLPTEAEWEYVSKADTNTIWSFGDLVNQLNTYAYRGPLFYPRVIGENQPNDWGVYDLYGNVYEWTEDWFESSRPSSAGGCPPENGTFIDDYEFTNAGDLDECNGMSINGDYGYYVSEAYPWVIKCFKGTPDPSFNK